MEGTIDGLVFERLTQLPEDIAELLPANEREGFRFLQRLVDEWSTGTNRFSAAGEAFFGVRAGRRLVAVGGLNIDPFAGSDTIGRVRRLYVHPDWRGQGLGRRLVAAIVEAARDRFAVLRVRTETTEGAAFYEAVGFSSVSGDNTCTPVLLLGTFPAVAGSPSSD